MKEVETPPAEKASRTQTAALLCSALLLARAVAEFCTVRRGRRRILPAHPLRPLSCPIVLVAAAGFIGGADGLSSAPPPRRARTRRIGSSSKHIQGPSSHPSLLNSFTIRRFLLFVSGDFIFSDRVKSSKTCVRACVRASSLCVS